ncbi:MAG TPA: choice-of-anchor D domain-containing protein, partial [Terriglobia bacterium]|nr:choice-of-anchor D domain-containing protein [Terriglobia bacterium]
VAINSLLAIYDKSGTRIGGYQQLSTFFSSLGITGSVFDPRLIYDQADQRYILSAGEIDFTSLTNGHIMLAVSATDDPTQTWYKFAINSKGRDISNKEDTFPDFPGLGLSSSAVYVTTNQFALTTACLATDVEGCYFSDAQIRVIGLAGLLAGNPSLTITTFANVQTADGFPGFTIQPALTYGSPGYEFLVAARFDNYTGTALDLFAIPTSGTLTLSTKDLTVPAYSIPPDAIQAGSSEAIFTNDFRPLNAVWAGGSLFLGQNVQSSLVAARWYQIILSDLASASLAQSGDIQGDGEAYYPAVSLKSDGTLAVLFTTSSQYTFASAAFTGRESADPPGAMRSYAIYRAGTDKYAESSFDNRWGDYSGISEDPDGNSVWGMAEYAGSPNPHFGTAIARISAPPALAISPSVLYFGGVLVGRSSNSLTVTVTNISEYSATLGNAATSGPNAGDFSIGNDACSGQTLAASQTCTFSVTFTPSTQSFEQASAGITYSGQQIAASATGYGYVAAVITPSSSALVFPDTAVGTASAPMTVTFTNSGNIATGTPSFYFYGTYSQTNNCTAPLAPGGSCVVTIVFHPAAPGTAYGLLIFQNSGQQGASVSLSGIGVGIPTLLFCPSSVEFATQTVSTTSSAQSVIITNSGSKTLNITEISTSGDFSQINNCPGTLPQQSNCVVTVSFTPTASGARTGAIQVSDNAPGSPHMLPLTGSGSTTSAAFRLDPADSISTREVRRAPSSSDLSASSRPGNGAQALARQPLAFEKNTGQFEDGVSFVARRRGRSFAVTRSGIMIALAEGDAAAQHHTSENPTAHSRTTREAALVRMTLPGADPARPAIGTGELPGKTNYFFGSDTQKWTRDVPTYEKVNVHGIYPGIDLIYYGNQSRLEYDFVLAPGANPKSIRLKFEGQSGLRIEKHSGDLVLNTPAGEIRFHRPLVYQSDSRRDSSLSAGNQRTVTGRYILTASNEVSFRVGRHDPARELVIDPIISFSTYLAGTVNDAIQGLAIDSSGNVYVTGTTYSLDFPVTPGAFQRVCGSSTRQCVEPYLSSPFISKLSADGSTLMYSTFLGRGTTTSADNGSVANAIAVDSS